MRSIRVLPILIALVAMLGFARAESAPSPGPGFALFKRGGLSWVYRNAEQRQIVKIIGPRALPKSGWINYPDWLSASGGRISAAQRAFLTTQTMDAYAGLKGDRRFALRFGALLPETRSPGAGRIEQTFVKGLDWDELTPFAQRRAAREMGQILKSAQRALPGQQVDHNKYNFVFDRAGGVRAWVDWVISQAP